MGLTDAFPGRVKIGGKLYEINTDFRVCLRIMQAFEDARLLWFEKQAVMCGLLFPIVPDDFEAACKAAVRFLDCEKPPTEYTGNRVYSFTRDADYIYSAFLQTFGVDLKDPQTHMHWWKFCAMFGDLSPDTTFENMRLFREKHNRGLLTKEERQIWTENAELLDLNYEPPDAETREAIEKFERLLRG